MEKHIYALKYIMYVMLFSFLVFFGLPNILAIHYALTPLVTFIVVRFGIISSIQKSNKYNRKDILYSYIFITTIFNLLFLYIMGISLVYNLINVVSNILVIIIFKTPKDKLDKKTNENINNYFKGKDIK